MMQRYWQQTYLLQLAAVGAMFLALLLRWHTEHGTGIQLLGKALETKIAFSLGDPFNPDYLAVSQWWLVWIIPLVAAAFGLRAMNGFVFVRLKGQRKLVLGLAFLLLVSFGWYLAAFYEELLHGFWLEVTAAGVLLLLVIVELMLPEQSAEERRIAALPPDHPERIALGQYQICPNCGEYNDFNVKNCRRCNALLFRD